MFYQGFMWHGYSQAKRSFNLAIPSKSLYGKSCAEIVRLHSLARWDPASLGSQRPRKAIFSASHIFAFCEAKVKMLLMLAINYLSHFSHFRIR